MKSHKKDLGPNQPTISSTLNVEVVKPITAPAVGGGSIQATKKSLVQTKIFDCVVEAKDKDGLFDMTNARMRSDLSKLSIVYSLDYWFILHNQDINEDGTPKHWHYHVVLRFPSRHTPLAVVNLLSDYLCLPKVRISVDKATSLEGCLKYLIHDNDSDFDSHRYATTEVFTNDSESFSLAMANSLEKPTSDFLIEIGLNCTKVEDIIRAIGADNYVRYRWLFHDLRKGLN